MKNSAPALGKAALLLLKVKGCRICELPDAALVMAGPGDGCFESNLLERVLISMVEAQHEHAAREAAGIRMRDALALRTIHRKAVPTIIG
jgi:hypothetical protein